MKPTNFTKAICLLLAMLCCFSSLGLFVSASNGGGYSNSLEQMKDFLAAKSYKDYLDEHAGTPAGKKEFSVDLSTADSADGANFARIDSPDDLTSYPEANPDDFADLFEANEVAVYLPNTKSVSFTFDIPADGMYYISFSYYTLLQSVNSVERVLYIDGSVPFSEARYLTLSKMWKYNYASKVDPVTGKVLDWSYDYPERFDPETGKSLEDYFETDLIGNSLTPEIEQVNGWRTYFCSDSSGFTAGYYAFFLSEGSHTITLEAEREACILGAINLIPADINSSVTRSYAEYKEEHKDKTAGEGEIRIEAEKPSLVSDSSVYMNNDRTSSITSPSDPTCQLYNVIGSNSYNSVGQWAAYDFTVTKSGLYKFVMRYKQATLEGMYICRALKLSSSDGTYGLPDGTPTLPFEEAYQARFDYSKDWQVAAAGDGNQDFEFYFEEGVTYTLYLEVSLGSLATQLQTVSDSLAIINDCYLQILQLTGAEPDADRDYGFKEIMPDVIINLNKQAIALSEVMQEFIDICGTTGQHLSTLELVYNLLATMGTDEDEISDKLGTLKSYLGTLGTWLNDSKTSSLTLDWVEVTPADKAEKEYPRARAGFFKSTWFEIRAFVSSFFTEYNNMGVTSEEALSDEAIDVWLAAGRDQSNIWRSLIDSDFSKYCEQNQVGNLPVALKLITAGTLLPSSLAGKGPDVYMGLDSTTTINYAIRGAIVPVVASAATEAKGEYSSLAGANEYLNNDEIFHKAAIKTVELLGDIYGVPQTMNFSMMYYRLDVLVKLGLEIPKTWEELLGLLPALQANNLVAGIGLRSAANNTNTSSEGLNTTFEIMLYQYGCDMWQYTDPNYYGGAYAGAQIGLSKNEALDAFRYYCRFYTDYSFPYQYDGANRFRTGEMPIMIGDYVNAYNQLVVFATEIDGLWEFSPIPGIADDEGNINNDAIATVTNLVIPYSKNRTEGQLKQAWEYIKWNSSAEAQSTYGNRMVALIGPSAKYATANMQAVEKLSWTSKESSAIQEQLKHISSVKNYPGSYIIARYINFAFFDAYNNGVDPVNALQSYISAINDELSRKREEFKDSGLKVLENGKTPEQAEQASKK